MGPRDSGQQRSITVPHGQSEPQFDSRIGRYRAAGLYMACKGSIISRLLASEQEDSIGLGQQAPAEGGHMAVRLMRKQKQPSS
jgi:hypothetical protein